MQEECSGLSVGIVDDEPELVEVYRQLFCHIGITVVFVAYNGRDAIEQFEKASVRPSIMIVDYRMQGMNGIELMKKILQVAPGTRVIFVSADERVRQEALCGGAKAFLGKPAGLAEIRECIAGLSRR